MKLSESNIIKTLNNWEEIRNKAVQLLIEIGYEVKKVENVSMSYKVDTQEIELLLNTKDTFKLPVSYFLDPEGEHEGEYVEKKKKQQMLNQERFKKYIKNK